MNINRFKPTLHVPLIVTAAGKIRPSEISPLLRIKDFAIRLCNERVEAFENVQELTKQVEAEYGKSCGSKEREDAVQGAEYDVEERVQWWGEEYVKHDLQEPHYAEACRDYTKD